MADAGALSLHELAIRIRDLCGYRAVSAHNARSSANGNESMPSRVATKSQSSNLMSPPAGRQACELWKLHADASAFFATTFQSSAPPCGRVSYSDYELILSRLQSFRLSSPASAVGSRSIGLRRGGAQMPRLTQRASEAACVITTFLAVSNGGPTTVRMTTLFVLITIKISMVRYADSAVDHSTSKYYS